MQELLLVGVAYCRQRHHHVWNCHQAFREEAETAYEAHRACDAARANTNRVIFDILKEHGPLTVGDTWERVKVVGLIGLTSKSHMKILMRWMRERQKPKLICNHVGPHKQFLYTTWFAKVQKPKKRPDTSRPKLPCHS